MSSGLAEDEPKILSKSSEGEESTPINKNDTIAPNIENRDVRGRFVKASAATPIKMRH